MKKGLFHRISSSYDLQAALSWRPFGPTSCLSPAVILYKGVSFATLTSPTQCQLGRTRGFSTFVDDFWLAQHPETTEMLVREEGCSSAHIQKSDSLGGRGLVLVHGLHR